MATERVVSKNYGTSHPTVLRPSSVTSKMFWEEKTENEITDELEDRAYKFIIKSISYLKNKGMETDCYDIPLNPFMRIRYFTLMLRYMTDANSSSLDGYDSILSDSKTHDHSLTVATNDTQRKAKNIIDRIDREAKQYGDRRKYELEIAAKAKIADDKKHYISDICNQIRNYVDSTVVPLSHPDESV
jgi:hypothetical protein